MPATQDLSSHRCDLTGQELEKISLHVVGQILHSIVFPRDGPEFAASERGPCKADITAEFFQSMRFEQKDVINQTRPSGLTS
jgi:hypothetical protein